MTTIKNLSRRLAGVIAVAALVVAMGGTWMTSSPADANPVATAAAASGSSPPAHADAPATAPGQADREGGSLGSGGGRPCRVR